MCKTPSTRVENPARIPLSEQARSHGNAGASAYRWSPRGSPGIVSRERRLFIYQGGGLTTHLGKTNRSSEKCQKIHSPFTLQNTRRPLLRHSHTANGQSNHPLTKTMPFFTSANYPVVHAYDLGCPRCWRCWWFWRCWYPWPHDVTPVIDVNEHLWGLPRWWPRWRRRRWNCSRGRIRPVEYLQHAQRQNQTSQLRDLVQAMAKHTQQFE